MTGLEIALTLILMVSIVCGVFASSAAYRNGIFDGYGYSKEPNCPGYKVAGDYLKRYASHRWPELKKDTK